MKRPVPKPKPKSAMPNFAQAMEIARHRLNLKRAQVGGRLVAGKFVFFKDAAGRIMREKAR